MVKNVEHFSHEGKVEVILFLPLFHGDDSIVAHHLCHHNLLDRIVGSDIPEQVR